jgi:hypothetical protein
MHLDATHLRFREPRRSSNEERQECNEYNATNRDDCSVHIWALLPRSLDVGHWPDRAKHQCHRAISAAYRFGVCEPVAPAHHSVKL